MTPSNEADYSYKDSSYIKSVLFEDTTSLMEYLKYLGYTKVVSCISEV